MVNKSIPTDDFLDVTNQFFKRIEEFFEITFFWIGEYQYFISEIITKWGFCYSYNMAFSHDVLNLNLTSKDFHYLIAHRYINQNEWTYQQPPKKLPKRLFISNIGLWVGFGFEYEGQTRGLESDLFDGYTILIHNPYELPSEKSRMFRFHSNTRSHVPIDVQINAIDETLLDYEPFE